MIGSTSAHLYPCEWSARAPVKPSLPSDWRHGRQWSVDAIAYGAPYVFARISETAAWMVAAGPFVDVAAAHAWIEAL